MTRKILVVACLLMFAPAAFSQVGNGTSKSPVDPRVKASLDQLGYRYELNSDNDYKLIPIETTQIGTSADGKPKWRNNLVYVNSNTEKYGRLEIREVLAPAFLVDGPLSADVANRLLRENNLVKLGAWRVVIVTGGKNAGKRLVMFVAQIAADSDAESLRLAIKSVTLIADKMEMELTNADEY